MSTVPLWAQDMFPSKRDNLIRLQSNLLQDIWDFPTSANNTNVVIIPCFITSDSFSIPWSACTLNPNRITIFHRLAGLEEDKRNINCKHMVTYITLNKTWNENAYAAWKSWKPHLIITSSWWAVEQALFGNSSRGFWLQYRSEYRISWHTKSMLSNVKQNLYS